MSCIITSQLTCAFVFAFERCWFSDAAAHTLSSLNKLKCNTKPYGVDSIICQMYSLHSKHKQIKISVISSPEPMAHKVSLNGLPMVRRPSVRPCVRSYFQIQISPQLVSQWQSALGFEAGRIRTIVSMATDSSHRVIIG